MADKRNNSDNQEMKHPTNAQERAELPRAEYGAQHTKSAAKEAREMKEEYGRHMTPREMRETMEVNDQLRNTSPFDPNFASEAGRKGGLTGAGGEAVKNKYIDSWRKDTNEDESNS